MSEENKTRGAGGGAGWRTGVGWKNWAGNVSSTPEYAAYPETREDLVEIVRRARAEGKKIRVAGKGHSWSPLVPTDGLMVFVDRLNKVSVDVSNPAEPRVTVETGATVADVIAECRKFKVCLPTNVVPELIQYGGLVATGSHGSGWDMPTLSDLIESIDIIDSSGTVRVYTEAGVGGDVMNAARLNLGLFGIIHRMTLRAAPAFNVRATDSTRARMSDTLRDVKEIVRGHDYVDLIWFPFNENLWLKVYDRTDRPATVGRVARAWRTAASYFQMQFSRVAWWWLRRNPRRTPGFSRLMFKTISNRDVVEPVEAAIHYQKYIELLKATNVEFAFPIDEDFEIVRRAWQVVIDKTSELAGRGEYPLNMMLVGRCIANSRALLSPAFGDRHVFYLEIISSYGTEGWEKFSDEIAQEWMRLPGARIHWGKEFEQIRGIVPFVRRSYGERLTRFLQIRDELGVDPERMFVNPFLERLLFGPE